MHTVGQELFVRFRVCCECAKMRVHHSNKMNKDLTRAVFSKMNVLRYLQSVNRLPTPNEAGLLPNINQAVEKCMTNNNAVFQNTTFGSLSPRVLGITALPHQGSKYMYVYNLYMRCLHGMCTHCHQHTDLLLFFLIEAYCMGMA